MESFRKYSDGLIQSSLLPKQNTHLLARQTLLVYQGAMASWRMTLDVKFTLDSESLYGALVSGKGSS
ncbi:MAG: hypothetical protein K8S54_06765 [Spirochaetia bacterium]|nr:hypothetical protein [Spirochaetia bacterium]